MKDIFVRPTSAEYKNLGYEKLAKIYIGIHYVSAVNVTMSVSCFAGLTVVRDAVTFVPSHHVDY